MVKLFVVAVIEMVRSEMTRISLGVCQHTPAMPILLPHHHLFVLFSSREEGNSLAEAEAALSTCVMFHLGARNTR